MYFLEVKEPQTGFLGPLESRGFEHTTRHMKRIVLCLLPLLSPVCQLDHCFLVDLIHSARASPTGINPSLSRNLWIEVD
jgi:hypothetical protein